MKLVFFRLEVGLISGPILAPASPKQRGVVNLRNKRTKICSITTAHNHIRQASSAHSIIEFGRPPSFDPARFSQTTTLKWSLPTWRTLCIWHLQYFQSFRNGCLFCTYWHIPNLNCTDSHHPSYGERCSIHHFQHCAQCVYEIYSVFKVFEIAVCFAHFGLFEISTPVRRIMLTMANIV